jgi:hypothetical protein
MESEQRSEMEGKRKEDRNKKGRQRELILNE